MTVLITGGGGQLAASLASRLGEDAVLVTRADLDITDEDAVAGVVRSTAPRAVINCAAYNAVDRAEEEPLAAMAVNAVGPRTLARVTAAEAVRFVHVSSDYVFGGDAGRGQPLGVEDRPLPVSAYGLSKLAGEHFVRTENESAAVVRTCGLYGQGGGNFVKTMLRLSQTMDVVRVVGDQRCTPTSCDDLSKWLVRLAGGDEPGLMQMTQSGDASWAEFAAAVFEAAGRQTRVEEITSAEFGAAARRPPYSVMQWAGPEASPRHWRDAVGEFVRQHLAAE